jgi:small subunit ribosomal protein S2
MAAAKESMLVEKMEYLTAGIHIGMKTCTPYMKRFVYKIRDDGLSVFNLKMVDERIKIAADFISKFNKTLVVSRKENAGQAITKFAEQIGAKAIAGRFPPGTLTNPSYKDFYEPELIVIADSLVDDQVVREAKKKRIPIVALADTFNTVKDIDYIIPANNNGKKAIALIFWILTREILKNKEKIKSNEEFKLKVEDFGSE